MIMICIIVSSIYFLGVGLFLGLFPKEYFKGHDEGTPCIATVFWPISLVIIFGNWLGNKIRNIDLRPTRHEPDYEDELAATPEQLRKRKRVKADLPYKEYTK